VIKRLFSSHAFRHVAAGCVLINFAANCVSQFAPSFFVRNFGLGLAQVGLMYGLTAGASGVLGMLIGGYGTDAGAKRDVRWRAWLPALGALLALPAFLLAFTRDTPILAMAFVFVGCFGYSLYFAPTFAITQNLVDQRMRGTAAALMFLLINIFGGGLAPTALGAMSDFFARRAFTLGPFAQMCPGGVAPHGSSDALVHACRAASAGGLKQAILIGCLAFAWGAVHYLLATRSIRRELAHA
jgi:hypothetical protein